MIQFLESHRSDLTAEETTLFNKLEAEVNALPHEWIQAGQVIKTIKDGYKSFIRRLIYEG